MLILFKNIDIFLGILLVSIISFNLEFFELLYNIDFLKELIEFFILLTLITFIHSMVLKNIISIAFLTLIFITVSIQMFSFYMTGDSLNLAAIANADQVNLLLNDDMIYHIFVLFIIYGILLKYTFYYNRINKRFKRIFLFSSIMSLIILFLYVNSVYYSCKKEFNPCVSSYRLLKLYLNQKRNNLVLKSLSNTDLNIARQFNISINSLKPKPFQKLLLYKKSLPFKNKNSLKPNVIIFFVESLSARLIGPYNTKRIDMTKNISDFAQHSTVIDGYYNHATPTAPALYGQNCSLYPLYTYTDMNKDPNPLKKLDLQCLASFFNVDDYNTTYLTHASPYGNNIKDDVKIYGYKQSYYWRNLLNIFLPQPEDVILGETGASDHQMMRSTIGFLKKNNNKTPFLLTVSTIETHIGLTPNSADGLSYKNGENNTLSMVYNLDDAFGLFWNYFKHSKYYKNTIVVLTGDHALYPNKDYKKIAGKDWIISVYDKMSLIIYDPVDILPPRYTVNATSVDFAPTILHLAHINSRQKNTFMGTSIFEPKNHNNSFGISAYPDFNYYLNLNGKIVNQKIKNTDNKDEKKIYKSLYNVIKFYNFTHLIKTKSHKGTD